MPWAYGWNVVGVSLIFQAFAYGTVISSFTLFLPLWARDFAIAKSTVTSYVTVSVILGGIAAVVIGKLLDRFSVKKVLLVGAALYSLSYLLLSMIGSGLQLFFVYSILLSFSLVMLSILPSQVLVARWFPTRSSVPISIVATGMALGGIVLPPLVAFLIIELDGWRAACRAVALLMTLFVIPLILLIVRDGPAEATAAGTPARRAAALGDRSILGDSMFLLALCAAVPLYTIYSGFQANLGPMVLASGRGLADVSFNLVVLNGASLVASLSAGWLRLRIAHRTLFHISAVLAMAGVLGFMAASDPMPQLVASALIGLGTGATGTTLTSYYFAAFSADRMGTVLGYAAPFSRIAVFAPPLFALGGELTGGYTLPLIGLSALAGITLVGATLMAAPVRR